MKSVMSACLLIVLPLACGCNVARWLSTTVWPENEEHDVEAEYHGLEGKNVAVMVAADEYMLFRYPMAQLDICRAVTQRLVDNMSSVTVMNPQQVIDYQRSNPYWHSIRHGELIEGVGVDRIVLIELIEYRTQEPGNAHVWHGLVTGNVGVIEADAPDPDDFVFYTTVRTQFPEGSTVGVVNSDDASIRLGMHSIFSRDAAGLFYDHKVIKPKETVVGKH